MFLLFIILVAVDLGRGATELSRDDPASVVTELSRDAIAAPAFEVAELSRDAIAAPSFRATALGHSAAADPSSLPTGVSRHDTAGVQDDDEANPPLGFDWGREETLRKEYALPPASPNARPMCITTFPAWPSHEAIMSVSKWFRVDPCPTFSRAARRIHNAATYGITGVYDGKTLVQRWSIDYDCNLIRKAIKELENVASDYTVNLECAADANAHMWLAYAAWASARGTPVPLKWHKDDASGPVMATGEEEAGVPTALRNCLGYEGCFRSGFCKGCMSTTLTTITFHENK